MITKAYQYLFAGLASCVMGSVLTACSDFLYEESDQYIYAEDHALDSDADTLWTMAGIMNKMQVLADRTILLGEVRADLVDLTDHASADLRQMANFSVTADNQYNRPRDYYAVINNCNFFIARADTALRDNRHELIFRKEYAAVKAFRAWKYGESDEFLFEDFVWEREAADFIGNPRINFLAGKAEKKDGKLFVKCELDSYVFPEEDFYLDETGNPVFYLQPGFAEGTDELLRFPISIEEILDEM